MTATGLKVVDTTIHVLNVWLDDLMTGTGWTDKHKAYYALRVVLHALRDRLPVNDAAHLGAQLPMLVRGFYYEGWRPADKPLKERSQEEFLAHVAEGYRNDPEAQPRAIAQAVLKVLVKHVTPGEIDKIKHCLPSGVRELFP
ncbi:MAG: DUF2267 domain-containing protein [Planctomycetia bacterium]|nr:DUF2267 domain-containing protein [Planctomycetia bacterium]